MVSDNLLPPFRPIPGAASIDVWRLEVFELRNGRWRRRKSVENRLKAQARFISDAATLHRALAALAAQRATVLRAVETRALADPAQDAPALCVEREDSEGTLHFDFPLTARLLALARDAASRREPFFPELELQRVTRRRADTFRIVHRPDVNARRAYVDPRHRDLLPLAT